MGWLKTGIFLELILIDSKKLHFQHISSSLIIFDETTKNLKNKEKKKRSLSKLILWDYDFFLNCFRFEAIPFVWSRNERSLTSETLLQVCRWRYPITVQCFYRDYCYCYYIRYLKEWGRTEERKWIYNIWLKSEWE